jgi:hypothetical protein
VPANPQFFSGLGFNSSDEVIPVPWKIFPSLSAYGICDFYRNFATSSKKNVDQNHKLSLKPDIGHAILRTRFKFSVLGQGFVPTV